MVVLAALVLGALAPADPHSKADLLVSSLAARPGSSFDVAVRFRMDPEWHVYWINPGESGVSPTIAWNLPKGWKASPIQWPAPERIEKEGIVNYVYEHEVLLHVRLTAPATAKIGTTVPLRANVKWLCCQEACIPAQAKLERTVRIRSTEAPDPKVSPVIAKARRALPATTPKIALRAWKEGGSVRLSAFPRGDGLVEMAGAAFYPADDSIDPSAPQKLGTVPGGVALALTVASYAPKPPTRLRGLLVAPEGKEWQPGLRAMAVDIPIER